MSASEPLPHRDVVFALLASRTRPLSSQELAARLRVSQGAYAGFVRFLENLAQEGALRALGSERFALPQSPRAPGKVGDDREGVLSGHARGFGFVRSVGHTDNLYIPEDAMGGALHGDTVVARPVRRTSLGIEGEVVRVTKRGAHRLAGVLRRRGKSAWFEPDDTRIRGPLVLHGPLMGNDGDAAVATITRYPILADENPEGALLAVLGTPGDPLVEVAKILVREGVEEDHPHEAVAEATRFGSEVSPEAIAGREDLTHIPLPTIDPEDARDHDDAVWVERHDDGSYTAWVAIADVSHYVTPGSEIDAVAKERGCSIYLPTRSIPMLPRPLSSNLCSLLPDVLRLCLCAIIELDANAQVTRTKLVRGVMRSCAKLTYPGVAKALGFTEKPSPKPEEETRIDEAMLRGLRVADELSQKLRVQRLRRGALDFQLPEPKVLLDPTTGAPTAIERRAEDPGVRRAYQLIEELMLLTNEVVAKFLSDRSLPAIFRVHASPDDQKLELFAALAEDVGLAFDVEDAKDPKKLSALLRRVAKHPRADVLNMLLLRTMKQASYDTVNIGHFGLASQHYLHFTSPIRRYPDLVVHRLVAQVLRGEPSDKTPGAEEALRQAAQIASERERRAMEVEREVMDLYRALYMRAHIGETFEGTVTGLVGNGAFVSLDSPFVDVMVRADAMGRDTYTLDDDHMKFIARRSGDSIGLGDRMVVTIEDVAVLRRTVYAWRHAPDLADGGPLRHSPFGREKAAHPPSSKNSPAAPFKPLSKPQKRALRPTPEGRAGTKPQHTASLRKRRVPK